MSSIGKFLAVSAFALGGTLPVTVWAQAGSIAATATSSRAGHMTEGEIRRIHPETGKLTIRHGEIRNLDMPPMTMVFTARDKAQLSGLKVGDRIRFVASYEGGQYLVADIQQLE